MSELRRLGEVLQDIGRVAVAVSGGIDSLTLATAARRVLGPAATMHHATSPAVPAEATLRTRRLAAEQSWALDVFDAGEFADPAYRANPANRCFFCKTNLYGAIAARTERVIASGTNLDDLGDWRPGLEAARDHGVRHPLVEAGIDKMAVRNLARALGLGDLAELPAAPCLSSRMETGLRIEPAVLAAIDAVERQVRARLRPATVRCRVRPGRVVLELDAASLAELPETARTALRDEVARLVGEAGITAPVALAAYRMGSAFVRPAAA